MAILKKLCPVFLFIAVAAGAEELHLKDGTVLQGERLRQEDSVLVFQTKLGEVRVPLAEVDQEEESVSRRKEKEGVDPSGQTLVLMPTAFTPPAGTWSFKDFELFFLTLGYSPTSSTSVSVGALFPIAPSTFEILTFGVKQQVFLSSDGQTAIAVDGNIIQTILAVEDVSGSAGVWNLNLIGSWESPNTVGFHGAIGLFGPFSGEGSLLTIALGTDIRMTPHAKFIAEYFRGSDNDGDGAGSVINLGFRIHGEKLSADICGFRPVEDSGDLFLWPLINIGYRF